MNIDIVFKIAAIGILIAVLNQLLIRSGREDMATMATIAGLVIVLLMVVNMVSDLFTSIKQIFELY
ncbi:MAG: stage III sporulation protein AC [Eubacteriales bacterium]